MYIINNDSDNLLIFYQLDRLIKPIDLSITATDTSSPTNEQTSSLSSSGLPTAAALNYSQIKHMFELTFESARVHEKLQNEIGIYFYFSLFQIFL